MSTRRQITKLNGKNYASWSFQMRRLLRERHLDTYINPDGDHHEEDPERDGDALSELVFAVEDNQLQHIMHAQTALEARSTLEDLHRHASKANRIQLKSRFMTITQSPNMSVEQFIGQVNSLATELIQLGENITDEDKSIILLHGVRPAEMFMTIRDNLIENEKTSNFAHVCNSLLNKQLSMSMTSPATNADPETALFTAKRRNPENIHPKNRQLKPCYRCGGTNHRQESCRFKDSTCNSCGKQGHIARVCRSRGQGGNGGSSTHGGGPRNGRNNRNGGNHNRDRWDANLTAVPSLFMTASQTNNDNDDQFYTDCACSNHVTFRKDWLHGYESLPKPIVFELTDKSSIKAIGCGSVQVTIKSETRIDTFMIHDVLYIPEATRNLISIGQATKRGLTVQYRHEEVLLMKNGHIVLTATQLPNNLYRLNMNVINAQTLSGNEGGGEHPHQGCIVPTIAHSITDTAVTPELTFTLLHRRLGHASYGTLETLIKNNVVKGIPERIEMERPFCPSCALSKAKRLPFRSGNHTPATNPLEVLHADSFGPTRTTSLGGATGGLVIRDEFTNFLVVFTHSTKTKTLDLFKKFVMSAMNHWHTRGGYKVCFLQTDNGTEFVNSRFREFMDHHGIHYRLSAPYTPEQNGKAERANLTIQTMARSLLHDAKMPDSFWAEAVNHAVFLLNLLPSKAIPYSTRSAYERWFGKTPDITDLRIFGCPCYALIKHNRGSKFQPRSIPCRFLGFSTEHKAYRLWPLSGNRVTISRDVQFDESDLPAIPDDKITPANSAPPSSVIDVPKHTDLDIAIQTGEDDPDNHNTMAPQPAPVLPDGPAYHLRPRPTRTIHLTASATGGSFIPGSFAEAQDHPEHAKWHHAMLEEFTSLTSKNTWTLVPRSPDMAVIDSKWVFDLKRDSQGHPIRYKARFVAKGFQQRYGTDYIDVFAPVFRLETFRFLLTLGTLYHHTRLILDVKTAFLNGKIDPPVYVTQPPGFATDPTMVCRVTKGLYGLKQSARSWFIDVHNRFVSLGFCQLTFDKCLFVNPKTKVYILVWVDDMLISGPDKDANITSSALQECWTCTANADMFFINHEIISTDTGIIIRQMRFIQDLLHRFGMHDANPVPTPCDSQILSLPTDTALDERLPYREAIGSLIYLTFCTRPDLAFAVNTLAKHQTHASGVHWSAVKRVFRYLTGTHSFALHLTCGPDPVLRASCDASYASDPHTRKSISGLAITFGSALIQWRTKQQATVATSTTIAECNTLSEGLPDILHLRQLVDEFGLPSAITPVQQDNRSTVALLQVDTFSNRTKHIAVRLAAIKEEIANQSIRLVNCPSADVVADFFTKPLPYPDFARHRLTLGLIEM